MILIWWKDFDVVAALLRLVNPKQDQNQDPKPRPKTKTKTKTKSSNGGGRGRPAPTLGGGTFLLSGLWCECIRVLVLMLLSAGLQIVVFPVAQLYFLCGGGRFALRAACALAELGEPDTLQLRDGVKDADGRDQ